MKATAQKEPPWAEEHAYALDHVLPEVNIFESSEGYVLEVQMPGVNKDRLELTLEGTEITLVGRRDQETVPGEPLLRECQQVDYRRVFELDPAIDTTRINAKMNQGMLTLALPKSGQLKPRRLSVSDQAGS